MILLFFLGKTYRLYVSAIMRISPSTAAIFCSDVGCWRPIPRKDIVTGWCETGFVRVVVVVVWRRVAMMMLDDDGMDRSLT